MRLAFSAAVAVLAVSIAAAVTASPAVGQKKNSPAAVQKKKAAAQMSVNQCIDLARQRGYTDSDLIDGSDNPASSFVLRCLQGRQR
jgi:hypothetical protein